MDNIKKTENNLVIDITLGNNNTTESAVVQAKKRTVLENWDKRRAVELGDEAGQWEVLYCSIGMLLYPFSVYFLFLEIHFCSTLLRLDPQVVVPPYALQGGQMRQVRCERTELKDVHVPLPIQILSSQPRLKPTKRSIEEEEALEDWNRRTADLFEWVGMACLGSQRWSLFFFFPLNQMLT